MAYGFGVGDRSAAEVDGARSVVHPAEALTGWAGLLGAEQGGLASQEIGDGRAGHDAGGLVGDRLDVVGIEIEVGADLLVNAAGDDFAPALGDPLELGVIDSRRLMEGHQRSILGLGVKTKLGNSA